MPSTSGRRNYIKRGTRCPGEAGSSLCIALAIAWPSITCSTSRSRRLSGRGITFTGWASRWTICLTSTFPTLTGFRSSWSYKNRWPIISLTAMDVSRSNSNAMWAQAAYDVGATASSPGCAVDAIGAPNNKYNAGTTQRFSTVEVISPPMITTASGYSISFPG